MRKPWEYFSRRWFRPVATTDPDAPHGIPTSAHPIPELQIGNVIRSGTGTDILSVIRGEFFFSARMLTSSSGMYVTGVEEMESGESLLTRRLAESSSSVMHYFDGKLYLSPDERHIKLQGDTLKHSFTHGDPATCAISGALWCEGKSSIDSLVGVMSHESYEIQPEPMDGLLYRKVRDSTAGTIRLKNFTAYGDVGLKNFTVYDDPNVDLPEILLREHAINWILVSIVGVAATPLSTCKEGYPFWLPLALSPVLARSAYIEWKSFETYFKHFPGVNCNLGKSSFFGDHPVALILNSRLDQIDILTDTLFVARAMQCSASITAQWAASWGELPILGPHLRTLAQCVGYGGFSVVLYVVPVLIPQGILGFAKYWGRTAEQRIKLDPTGERAAEGLFSMQDLASSSSNLLLEKCLELAGVQLRTGFESRPRILYHFPHLRTDPSARSRNPGRPLRIFIRCVCEQLLQLWNQGTFFSLTYSVEWQENLQTAASMMLSLTLLLSSVNVLVRDEWGETVPWGFACTLVTVPLSLILAPIMLAFFALAWVLMPGESHTKWFPTITKEEAERRHERIEPNSFMDIYGKFSLLVKMQQQLQILGIVQHWSMRPRAGMVAALLLWLIVANLVRLQGTKICESHQISLMSLRCVPSLLANSTPAVNSTAVPSVTPNV